MKKRKMFGYSLVGLIAIGAGLWVTGLGGRLIMAGFSAVAGPPGAFDPANVTAPAPDYSLIRCQS